MTSDTKITVFDIIKECAQTVFDSLGSGHSEAIYHSAMEVEFRHKNIMYSTKAPIALTHRSFFVGWCIADLILHSTTDDDDIITPNVVIELKATTYAPRSSEKAQLLGYLRALNLTKGCLINFPQPTSTRNVTDVDFLVIHQSQQTDVDEVHNDLDNELDNVNTTTIPIINLD